MKLKIALAALVASVAPANALTLDQAMNELAGMHCSGSSCTSSTTVTDSRTVLVSPAVSGDPAPIANTDDSYTPGWWNAKCKTIAYVNEDCTAQSLNPGNLGGRPAVYGVESIETCTTTSKELTYNGPATSRDKAWSIDTSTSTRDGSC